MGSEFTNRLAEHRTVGEQAQLLIHDAHAHRPRGARGAEDGRVPIERDGAGVREQRTGERLHERRLARPVLAHNGMDTAGLHAQVRAVERDDAAVGLAQTSDGDCGYVTRDGVGHVE